MDSHHESNLREIIGDLPSKQDIHAMAKSIVVAKSIVEIHVPCQLIDSVDERVATLESSSSATDAWLSVLAVAQMEFEL